MSGSLGGPHHTPIVGDRTVPGIVTQAQTWPPSCPLTHLMLFPWGTVSMFFLCTWGPYFCQMKTTLLCTSISQPLCQPAGICLQKSLRAIALSVSPLLLSSCLDRGLLPNLFQTSPSLLGTVRGIPGPTKASSDSNKGAGQGLGAQTNKGEESRCIAEEDAQQREGGWLSAWEIELAKWRATEAL